MPSAIYDMSASELAQLADIVHTLAGGGARAGLRAQVLPGMARLLRCQFGASYRWDAAARRFVDGAGYNMNPVNLRAYDERYQFRDPISHRLRPLRRAALVDEALGRRELEHSEFYNDFLARDGLHHGVNIYFADARGRDVGDLRLWRAAGAADFGERDLRLLDLLAPYFARALAADEPARAGAAARLSPREQQVARLVAQGRGDREIARELGMAFTTVRTHLKHAMEKLECANRTALAARWLAGHRPPQD